MRSPPCVGWRAAEAAAGPQSAAQQPAGQRYGAPPPGGPPYPSQPAGEPERPKWSTRRTTAVTAVAAAAVLAIGGVAVAHSGSDSGPSTAQGPGGGGLAGPGGTGGPGGGALPGTRLAGALHGTLVTGSDGSYVTRMTQTGRVTAVSSTSITVKSTDGYAESYGLSSSTTVNGGQSQASATQTGHTVTVVATESGAATTVTDQSLASTGQNGQNGQNGQGGFPAAEPAAPPARAPPARERPERPDPARRLGPKLTEPGRERDGTGRCRNPTMRAVNSMGPSAIGGARWPRSVERRQSRRADARGLRGGSLAGGRPRQQQSPGVTGAAPDSNRARGLRGPPPTAPQPVTR
jgi:hypothetical protein